MITTKLVALQAPLGWLYRNGVGALNKPMKSIKETRRERLRSVIDSDRFRGSTAAFSKVMGYQTPSFASRLISMSPGNWKPIGDKMAREIERKVGLPEGFLDTPPAENNGHHVIRIGDHELTLEPLESQLVRLFKRLSEDSQERLIGKAQSLYVKEHPEEVSARNPFGIPTPSEQQKIDRGKTAALRSRKKR